MKSSEFLKFIHSRNYFLVLIASIFIFLSLLYGGAGFITIIFYFINFFFALSYISIFSTRKLPSNYFYASIILCIAITIGLFIFFNFFQIYSASYKIYLFPAFFVLNLAAIIYYFIKDKI